VFVQLHVRYTAAWPLLSEEPRSLRIRGELAKLPISLEIQFLGGDGESKISCVGRRCGIVSPSYRTRENGG